MTHPFGSLGGGVFGASSSNTGPLPPAVAQQVRSDQNLPAQAGGPLPSMRPAAATAKYITSLLSNLRLANQRLSLLPTNTLPSNTLEGLFRNYVTIQENLGVLQSRLEQANNEATYLSVQQDVDQAAQQVQGFIESVETNLGKHGIVQQANYLQGLRGLSGTSSAWRWVFWVLAATGTLVGGYYLVGYLGKKKRMRGVKLGKVHEV